MNINERSTFSPLPLTDSAVRMVQDDEIFNRARLVNTAFFMQVIVRDWVGVILGMVRDGSTWRLDPLEVTINDAIWGRSLPNFYSTRFPGIPITLSHPEVRGTSYPSNSTCCIGGMPVYHSKTRHGPSRLSRSCSQGKSRIRCEGFILPIIS